MRRIIILLTAILFTTVLLIACSKSVETMSTTEIINLGEKYLLELNYEEAVVQFTKLIEVEPKNFRGYTGLAESYAGLGDTDKAVATLKNGLEQLQDNLEIEAMLRKLTNSDVESAQENSDLQETIEEQDITEENDLSKQFLLSDADITNLGIEIDTDTTLMDLVDRYGLPRGYTSRSQLESDMKSGGLLQPDYEDMDSIAEWDNVVITSAYFDPVNWILDYADIKESEKLPFHLRTGMSIPEVVALIGIDNKTTELLQCSTIDEAMEYCQNNSITATLHPLSSSQYITASFGKWGVHIMDFRKLQRIRKSIQVYSETYTFSIRFYNGQVTGFIVYCSDEE